MCAQIVHCFFMSECLGSLVRGMLFLHQLPFSWWRHPVGIHLLVVGVCAHAPVWTHTPIHKGESGPPRVQGLRRPLCSAAANQDHLLPCFFLSCVSSFLVFFLSSWLFSPAPLPVWVMAIVHNFVSGYGRALHVCDVGGPQIGPPEVVRGFASVWLMGEVSPLFAHPSHTLFGF